MILDRWSSGESLDKLALLLRPGRRVAVLLETGNMIHTVSGTVVINLDEELVYVDNLAIACGDGDAITRTVARGVTSTGRAPAFENARLYCGQCTHDVNVLIEREEDNPEALYTFAVEALGWVQEDFRGIPHVYCPDCNEERDR